MDEKTNITIKTNVFEGPLELLLELIERRKLFVNDVALSAVTDEFLAYLEDAEEFPIEKGSQFLLVASTLVLIKSKSLLPNLELTDEEQSNINELEQRLARYKQYKDLTEHVRERFGKRISLGPQKQRKYLFSAPRFSPAEDVSAISVKMSIKDVLKRIPKISDIPQATVQKIVRLEDMIERLIDRVQTSLRTSFKDFVASGTGDMEEKKGAVIVSFLALLELVKRGIINVQQEQCFNDIEIETNAVGLPRY